MQCLAQALLNRAQTTLRVMPWEWSERAGGGGQARRNGLMALGFARCFSGNQHEYGIPKRGLCLWLDRCRHGAALSYQLTPAQANF